MRLAPKLLAVGAVLIATSAVAQQATSPAAATPTTPSPFSGVAAVPPTSLDAMMMMVTGISEAESALVRSRCDALMQDPKGSVDWKDTCSLFNLAGIMHPRADDHMMGDNP